MFLRKISCTHPAHIIFRHKKTGKLDFTSFPAISFTARDGIRTNPTPAKALRKEIFSTSSFNGRMSGRIAMAIPINILFICKTL